MTDHKRAKLKGKREEKRKRIHASQQKARERARKQGRIELAAARAIDESLPQLAHLSFYADIGGRIFKHILETKATEHLIQAGPLPEDHGERVVG